ncbi:hypothetical protein HYY75_08085 [bacterium]|nr:hypothetical protein [bacterium]
MADGGEVRKAASESGYKMVIDDVEVVLFKEDVEISSIAASDFQVQSEGDLTIALNKQLTHSLILEGLSREFVNKIQFMRKEKGLDIVDRIHVYYDSSSDKRNVP